MRKKLFILAAAILVVGTTACSGGSGGSGGSEGRFHDTMETFFFDFTVNGAYLADSYEGYTPAEGNTLLVAEVTVKNTYRESIEMYDTDFQAQWGDEAEDAYAYPIITDPETFSELDPVGDQQLPGTYLLAVDEERTGDLVFEVPDGNTDFSISYLEMFDDGTEDGDTGDVYFVYFTAEDQRGVSL